MTSSQMYLLLLALFTLTASTTAITTIYDILNQFGLPSGILPDSVTSYSTAPSDGDSFTFTVYLRNPCFATAHYDVHFESEVSGKINTDKITELKGYKVFMSWVWLTVTEITIENSTVVFTIGFNPTTKWDITAFQKIPTCRDGTIGGRDESNKLTS